MPSNQVTGRITITVGGKRLLSREGATLKYGGVERKGVAGDTGVHGYTEETATPGVECTISHTGETSLAELLEITSTTLVFEADTGRTYILRQAWCGGGLELSKGEVKLKFEAMSCEEMV